MRSIVPELAHHEVLVSRRIPDSLHCFDRPERLCNRVDRRPQIAQPDLLIARRPRRSPGQGSSKVVQTHSCGAPFRRCRCLPTNLNVLSLNDNAPGQLERRYVLVLSQLSFVSISIICPILHKERPTLLEHVAAPVGCLDLVTYRMCKCHFTKFRRMVRALGAPVAESGPKPVSGHIHLHALQQSANRIVREWTIASPPRNT